MSLSLTYTAGPAHTATPMGHADNGSIPPPRPPLLSSKVMGNTRLKKAFYCYGVSGERLLAVIAAFG